MARQTNITVENNFSRGLITEFTGLNAPENSVLEEENCVFNFNGEVTRRLGFDFEESYIAELTSGISTNSDVINTFIWKTVGDGSSKELFVVQVAEKIIFYEIDSTSNNISSNKKSFSVDLLTYKTSTATNSNVYDNQCQFSEGFGDLFIVHPYCEPVYIRYNTSGDSITATQIDVKVRDTEGVDDGLAVNERPSTLSLSHHYNLDNQAWDGSLTTSAGGGSTLDKITWFTTYVDSGNYPSHADIVYTMRRSDGFLDANAASTQDKGTVQAPRGRFILSAWDMDRDTASGLSGVTSTTSGSSRPSQIAFYAGRVFYSGVSAEGYAHKIFFTQIIERADQYGNCYQQNDPTHENYFDLLDNDGGVISIPEINGVVGLLVSGDFLFVFAVNGVWAISGTETGGNFKATDYTITKVTNIGAVSNSNIVNFENTPIWWNYDAIYTILFESGFKVQNLTETTIQTFYNEISDTGISNSKGVFNPQTRKLFWLYGNSNIKDRILVFDTRSSAFYHYLVATPTTNITIDSIEVIRSASADSGEFVIKYFVKGDFGASNNEAVTFAEFRNSNYVDWFSYDNTGQNFNSYFTTAYRIKNDFLKRYRNHYLMIITKYEDNASCFVSSRWDYSNNEVMGRWSTRQQCHKIDPYHDYHNRKLKSRGSGQVCNLRFESEDGKPFHLIGWATYEIGGSNP